MRDPVTSI
uniref:Uncharacterized protein n=1 Tax=Anguilla anguilla TaxID=7936 RepID=A0A0E9U999_ANGAN